MSKVTDTIATFNKEQAAFVTPRATAVFPWLSKAKTKVGDKVIKPCYTTDVRLDPNNAEHKSFIETMEQMVKTGEELIRAELPKGKQDFIFRSPLKDEYSKDDEGNETETGFVLFAAKTQATDKDGNVKKLTIVDSGKQAVTQPVFGGSEMKLICKPSLYSGGVGTGISIYLNAVQVLSLVTSGGADTSLFDVEEGFAEEASFADESVPAEVGTGDESDY